MSSALGDFFLIASEKYSVRRLGDLTSSITDGPHKTPAYVEDGIPFVTVKNMVNGKIKFSDIKYISPADYAEFSRRCKPEYGDVLYSKDGATRDRPCLVDTTREFAIFVSVALIKPIRELLYGRYLCHLLNSGWIRRRMANRSRGDMIPHIVLPEIQAFPVPLPAISEQHRIVNYLDTLQTKVDALKRLQTETATELDALLPSILDKAFKGEL
ncbi:MAG TPA: restriction endonuclease subunit S [Candidatus Methylomirabilis sp.]|nr:restriction endonuclease subunit S [Candidatus Methylomirabilis sp.]